MGQMSNRSSNRRELRFLGSFRNFARPEAVGSFRNFAHRREAVGSFRNFAHRREAVGSFRNFTQATEKVTLNASLTAHGAAPHSADQSLATSVARGHALRKKFVVFPDRAAPLGLKEKRK
jgi:hypothetical protein